MRGTKCYKCTHNNEIVSVVCFLLSEMQMIDVFDYYSINENKKKFLDEDQLSSPLNRLNKLLKCTEF